MHKHRIQYKQCNERLLTICLLFSIKWAPMIPRKDPKPSWKYHRVKLCHDASLCKIWTYFKVLKVDDLTQLRSHIQSPIATKPFVFLQAVVNFMVCSIAKLRAIYAIWPRYLHIVFQNSQSLWNTRKTPVTCTKHSVVLVKLACFSKSVEHNDTCCWIINWWVHSIQPYSNEVMANGHHNGGPSGK